MRRDHFRSRPSRVDALTETQRLREILSGRGEATVAALELGVDEERRCPCRDMPGSHGKARGLRRCGKGWTFNALAPLSRLRHGKRWLSFDESMAGGETLKEATERFAVTIATAQRHRFLEATAPDKLKGIVEETRVPALKERKPDREACPGSGKARKPGLSRGRVAVPVAAARSSATKVLPGAASLKQALEPAVDKDVLPVSDGRKGYCAAALGVEALNLSAGERVRRAFHTITGRHGQLQGLPYRCRGSATWTTACGGSSRWVAMSRLPGCDDGAMRLLPIEPLFKSDTG